jgi:hypothetical protein
MTAPGPVASAGAPRNPLGALSAAARSFDPEPLQRIVGELAQQALPLQSGMDRPGLQVSLDGGAFFGWFKCILGYQHLLSTCQNGVTIQVYLALIVSLLVTQWTGHKPTKRTFEMLCLYLAGWASEAELQAHVRGLDRPKKKSQT